MQEEFNINSMKKACDTFGGSFRRQSCEVNIDGYTIVLTALSGNKVRVDLIDKNGKNVGSSMIDNVRDILYDKDAISIFNKEDSLTISKYEPFVDSDMIK